MEHRHPSPAEARALRSFALALVSLVGLGATSKVVWDLRDLRRHSTAAARDCLANPDEPDEAHVQAIVLLLRDARASIAVLQAAGHPQADLALDDLRAWLR